MVTQTTGPYPRSSRPTKARKFATSLVSGLTGLVGLGLGSLFVEKLFALIGTQAFLSVLPPSAADLRLIYTAIQLLIFFSGGLICGFICGFVPATRVKEVVATVGFIYLQVIYCPHGNDRKGSD